MIALRENIMPMSEDEEIQTLLNLNDNQFQTYLEYVSSSEIPPEELKKIVTDNWNNSEATKEEKMRNLKITVAKWVKDNIK